MPYPAKVYVQQLRLLLQDLSVILEAWHRDADFEIAKDLAEAAAPLIAGEIGRLQKAPRTFNESDPAELRSKLEQLRQLSNGHTQAKLAEYIAMLDSLINEGVM